MNDKEIIREVIEKAAEYIEMNKDPFAFVAGVLAKRIVKLENYIKYLETRIKNENKE